MKVTVYRTRTIRERADIDVGDESMDGQPNELIRMLVELAKREGLSAVSDTAIYEADVNGRHMQMRGR